MSCNDILEKLEKEGIISAEGVIDSYLLCKHAEELFGKSYLKEHNIVLDDDKKEAKLIKSLEFENYFMEPLRSMEKRATIRKSDKGLKEGDLVKCTFEWTDDYLIRRVRSVEKVKFKDLDNAHAWFEGYKHVDLLKHELQCIYPDMWNNTVLFQIIFERPTLPLQPFKIK